MRSGRQDLADLRGLDRLTGFVVADATKLPFRAGQFSVVWSQCSLAHEEAWLAELARVVAPRGRLALTFEIRKAETAGNVPRWTLPDVAEAVRELGFEVDHAEDISQRDIELGWMWLDRRLAEREAEFVSIRGEEWVRAAHRDFVGEAQRMRDGLWGNGRLVATRASTGG